MFKQDQRIIIVVLAMLILSTEPEESTAYVTWLGLGIGLLILLLLALLVAWYYRRRYNRLKREHVPAIQYSTVAAAASGTCYWALIITITVDPWDDISVCWEYEEKCCLSRL